MLSDVEDSVEEENASYYRWESVVAVRRTTPTTRVGYELVCLQQLEDL